MAAARACAGGTPLIDDPQLPHPWPISRYFLPNGRNVAMSMTTQGAKLYSHTNQLELLSGWVAVLHRTSLPPSLELPCGMRCEVHYERGEEYPRRQITIDLGNAPLEEIRSLLETYVRTRHGNILPPEWHTRKDVLSRIQLSEHQLTRISADIESKKDTLITLVPELMGMETVGGAPVVAKQIKDLFHDTKNIEDSLSTWRWLKLHCAPHDAEKLQTVFDSFDTVSFSIHSAAQQIQAETILSSNAKMQVLEKAFGIAS